ncbi:MAG: K(+)-transporting ATPase subunit F [Thermaerobacter sp.]|nr:K(+)-transporting ATPase subunit F [Thermaerobacter sp.]
MSVVYIIGGTVTVLLLIYLFYAFLFPERM